MKIKIKKIMGLVLGTTILASSIGFAAPEAIQAFNQPDFTIKVNGLTQVHPEGLKPIVYNNRTYLPVAFIAELLGSKVSFDSDNKTVSIDEDKSELILAKEKIEKYEKEIQDLNSEIEKLKLETSESSSQNYSKLPTRATQDGYSLSVEGLSVREGDGRLFVSLKNTSAESGVKLKPLDTILEFDGTKYKSEPTISDSVGPELFQWVKRGDTLNAVIPFRNLPDDKDIEKMKITIFLETNSRFPVTSFMEFYVIND